MQKHPTALIAANAVIGQGTKIWHAAQVRENAEIGEQCIIGKGVYIDAGVKIGHRCKLQNGVNIYHPAEIGDGVFFGPGAMTTNDRFPRAINPDGSLKSAEHWHKQRVVVRTGASIGARAVLLPGVTIGAWAMVGAGSIVTRDVPDFGLVVGHPARLVGFVCKCGRKMRTENGVYHCPVCETMTFKPVEFDEGAIKKIDIGLGEAL